MVNQFEAVAKLDPDRVVDNRTYVDPAVYQRELERVFDRCWLFVAHESELPEPGDYITARIAENPIVVARDRAVLPGARGRREPDHRPGQRR